MLTAGIIAKRPSNYLKVSQRLRLYSTRGVFVGGKPERIVYLEIVAVGDGIEEDVVALLVEKSDTVAAEGAAVSNSCHGSAVEHSVFGL